MRAVVISKFHKDPTNKLALAGTRSNTDFFSSTKGQVTKVNSQMGRVLTLPRVHACPGCLQDS